MLPKPINMFMMSKHGTILLYFVIFTAAILIGYSVISSYLFYTSDPQYTGTHQPITVTRQESSYSALMKIHLFGQYFPEGLTSGSVKQSLLKIKLVGIIRTVPIEDSFVMVTAANGRDKQVKVGEQIIPGVEVVKIMANEIWIKHDGQIERLELPEQKLKFLPVNQPIKMEHN